MELELTVNNRNAKVRELKRDGNLITIAVDDDIYEVDLVKVGKGEYSILYKGKSYNIEVIESENPKEYTVNTFYFTYGIEVIDAETRYMRSREDAGGHHGENIIRSPMPGKVVKIPVNVGDVVEKGQTVIIVSAMKMESEFKAGTAGKVIEIPVKEGDTIDGNQVMVVIEALEQ
ncbi:MAG: acetyl-CoA carboxylase biotin carboxyl carrier protein subunit [Bacteroidetes bacterium]|nr:acetyl-CoA carboxylase biotin carboxyl carrier protein subunit [Bacteroidota bacterium]